MDLYAYADGDPTSARDPSGMGAEPEPENLSPYTCLGTIRGCGGGNSDGGGGGGGGGGHFFMDVDADGFDDEANMARVDLWRLETSYLHLSKLGPGITVGVYVTAGQVIGYVGATGLGTGAHLDFRFSINGVFTDPAPILASGIADGWLQIRSPLASWRAPGANGDFGWRNHPVSGNREFHRGYDMQGNPVGTEVYAAHGGLVVFAGHNGNAGIMVGIRLDVFLPRLPWISRNLGW